MSDKAKEVLRVHLTELNDIIVNAGVILFADECEEKQLITSGAKHQLVSNLTGKSDSHRASSLNDSIRRAVCFEPDFILGQFLLIVFSVGGLPGQALAKTIAGEYGRPLPELDKVIAAANKKADAAMALRKKIKQEEDHSPEAPPPKTKELLIDLRELVRWEAFGEHLPEIQTHDINIIKRENPGDIEGQKQALYGKWLRVCPEASWIHVHTALKDADEAKLADKIQKEHSLHVPQDDKVTVAVKKESANGSDKPTEEKPDLSLDFKELYMKSPTLEDVLKAVPVECDCKEFRKALKLPEDKGDFKEAISVWINQEPSDVTWKNLLQALKQCSHKQTVRLIARNYLQRKSVYDRYINEPDFENMDDLGL